jgi:hypothetical protein
LTLRTGGGHMDRKALCGRKLSPLIDRLLPEIGTRSPHVPSPRPPRKNPGSPVNATHITGQELSAQLRRDANAHSRAARAIWLNAERGLGVDVGSDRLVSINSISARLAAIVVRRRGTYRDARQWSGTRASHTPNRRVPTAGAAPKLIGTSIRPQSPQRAPKNAKPKASRHSRPVGNRSICAPLLAEALQRDSLKIVVSPVRVRVSPSPGGNLRGGGARGRPRARRAGSLPSAGWARVRGRSASRPPWR